MLRKLFWVVLFICATSNVKADITLGGNVIVTPSLVGAVDYSVTPNKGRVTIDLFARSNASNQAGIASYAFTLNTGGALAAGVGSNVSVSIAGSSFFTAANFSGDSLNGLGTVASGAFDSGNYSFSGERPDITIPGLALATTDELVGRVVFDVNQTASAQNFTIASSGSSVTKSGNPNTQTNNSFTLTINALSGGGGGGGGGGGAAVPEPGSVLAVSVVLGGLGIRALRRRRQTETT